MICLFVGTKKGREVEKKRGAGEDKGGEESGSEEVVRVGSSGMRASKQKGTSIAIRWCEFEVAYWAGNSHSALLIHSTAFHLPLIHSTAFRSLIHSMAFHLSLIHPSA